MILLAGCATVNKPGYEQTITVSRPVENVPIAVSYQGGVFYHLRVNNTLQNAIKLMWDESTYVTTTGESVRILHLFPNNVPKYAPAQQAASIIPPHAQFQADFTGDDWIDCARRHCMPQPKDRLKNARIFLAFSINGKVVRWQGTIAFSPSALP